MLDFKVDPVLMGRQSSNILVAGVLALHCHIAAGAAFSESYPSIFGGVPFNDTSQRSASWESVDLSKAQQGPGDREKSALEDLLNWAIGKLEPAPSEDFLLRRSAVHGGLHRLASSSLHMAKCKSC